MIRGHCSSEKEPVDIRQDGRPKSWMVTIKWHEKGEFIIVQREISEKRKAEQWQQRVAHWLCCLRDDNDNLPRDQFVVLAMDLIKNPTPEVVAWLKRRLRRS